MENYPHSVLWVDDPPVKKHSWSEWL